MVGQLYLLLYLFYQAELFRDYKNQGGGGGEDSGPTGVLVVVLL